MIATCFRSFRDSFLQGIFLFALTAILILPVLGAASVGLLYPVYRRYLEEAP